MNVSESTHSLHRFLPESLARGSMTEGIGALGTIVLAILGLAGILTNVLASIATIVIGAVFLADSMLARTAVRSLNAQDIKTGLEGSMNAEFFAGIAGIVLGILSFFRPDPSRFVAVALLAFGAALMLSGGTLARLNWLLSNPQEGNSLASASNSGSVFMGLAVTALGILALVGIMPMTLALVGLLCLGTGSFFSESGRIARETH